ncbi:AraC family transcriptional regulator [Leptospira sarikeiensis]|uniref:Helix-turn-helix domain-containing protein n=1 Tax=Leptospira sarikeiensis TaxID=2484943 RepID=A0A4R9KEW0_9LEPT|nr:helix-turn-helix domain-containing protein [Leptospira sarikeiensis]TGL65747.1 helix-turn-helix domain-containing protein [Leptospira sarikeiensis]
MGLGSIYLLFGAAFGFIWALGILLSPASFGERVRIFFLLSFSSIWLLGGVSFFAGWTSHYTILYGFHLPFALGIAPVLYLHFQITLLGLPVSKTEAFFHFSTSMFCILLFLPFWTLGEEFRQEILKQMGQPRGYSSVLAFMQISPKIAILSYFLPVLWSYRSYIFRAEKNENEERARRMFLLYLILITFVISWGLVGTLLKRIDFVRESIFSLPALLVIGFLLSHREQNWLGFVGKSLREVRYKKSRLKGMDENQIKTKLEALMKKEKMYADEDLTLSQLADELKITNHQLSEFLNHRLSMKFSDYINFWRVEEAKILLLEDPDRSILAISESVGFNSKSAFNEAFKKFSDTTPSEFRKTAIKYKLSIKF